MSSFIGVTGKKAAFQEKIKNLLPTPGFSFEHQSLFICADVHPQTTFFHQNSDEQFGWIVCGIGISSGEQNRVLQQKDWTSAFQSGIDVQTELNGHFAIAKWDRNQIELTTDQIGMRNIFIHRGKDFTLFSTRLDWLIHLIPDTPINWHTFGSNWLAINPFSSGCIIKSIDRLAQGGKASITPSEYSFSNTRWQPSGHSEFNFEETLTNITSAALSTFNKTSLGLSGGLDSRVLFATLLANKSDIWDLYTFDNSGHPDTEIAKKLIAPFGRNHKVIPTSIPDPDELISDLKELSLRSQFTTSIAELPVISGYRSLSQEGLYTLDGAFGEIGRRRYLRGLELREKNNLAQWSSHHLHPYFKSAKADIFSQDVLQQMETGFFEEFDREVKAMPSVDEFGISNWLDLFTIRTRAQNLYGSKQGVIDETLFHFMPFLQPSVLNALLLTPAKERNNAKLFRSIIQQNASQLTKLPLVKGDESYPYWMKDISAMVWMKTKQKLSVNFNDESLINMVFSLEEFVRDTFSSQNFRKYEAYDLTKIDSLINQFYDEGDLSLTTNLSWFISFEVFRQQLFK